ncbi:hypothetical protein NQ317_015596 [Molorchus minor]|uniref:DNA primase/nucleoside triphosphatase C-terminal domain-containing protein n=1 Tax=Molorchus minor TaxID=1323400 RepID=A0ABQ9JVI1_9CUCU|nr:hypothetical protein NQ317_015596 [Molorchus minor]
MSDSEFECTPPEVRVAVERATEGIIPEKSRERYENTYELYSKWCVAKGVQHTSETVLLAYFCEISKQSKASTLWSRYSMLRAVLNFRHNVDISNYAKLKAFLKRKNVGYQAKNPYSLVLRPDCEVPSGCGENPVFASIPLYRVPLGDLLIQVNENNVVPRPRYP